MKFLTTLLYLGIRWIKSMQYRLENNTRPDWTRSYELAIDIKYKIYYFLVLKTLTRSRHCHNFNLIARRLPKLEPNEVFSCILRYEDILQVKLSCISVLKDNYKSLILIFEQVTKITEEAFYRRNCVGKLRLEIKQ